MPTFIAIFILFMLSVWASKKQRSQQAAGTCASQLEGIAAAACQARREPDKAARRCRCYCRAAVGMDIAWIGAGEDAEAGQ